MHVAKLSTIAHVAAGCARLSAQPAAILLFLSCARLSSPLCVATNGRAFSQLLASAAKAPTLKRSICLLSSKRFLWRANVLARPLAFPNVPLLDLAPPVSALDSSPGLPWEAPT